MRNYKIITSNKKVIAITEYLGQKIKGIATCDERDAFDIVIGQKIAEMKCNKKILKKQQKECKKFIAEFDAEAQNLIKVKEYWEKQLEKKENKIKYIDKKLSEF